MKSPDHILIKRSLAGNAAAFEVLVSRYQNFVFSLCLRVLNNKREDAEEVAQDVFVKVYQRLNTFKKQAKFSTWLYTLTYRTALDKARIKGLPMTVVPDMESTEKYMAPVKATDENIHQTELQVLIKQLLGKIDKTEATLLELYYLQEQSVKEITTVTGLSSSNVKTKLFRGRESLRKLMKKKVKKEISLYLSD